MTPAPLPTRKRWRFTIRQMLFATFLVAVALFLYREVPDMVRRWVYNDPVPLVIGSRSRIHIRQIPYLPGYTFLYRIALPRGREYELCAGVATDDELLPEPQQVKRLGYYSVANNDDEEHRLHGFVRGAGASEEELRLHVDIRRSRRRTPT